MDVITITSMFLMYIVFSAPAAFRIDSDTGDCEGATCGCREEYILEGEKCVTGKAEGRHGEG